MISFSCKNTILPSCHTSPDNEKANFSLRSTPLQQHHVHSQDITSNINKKWEQIEGVEKEIFAEIDRLVEKKKKTIPPDDYDSLIKAGKWHHLSEREAFIKKHSFTEEDLRHLIALKDDQKYLMREIIDLAPDEAYRKSYKPFITKREDRVKAVLKKRMAHIIEGFITGNLRSTLSGIKHTLHEQMAYRKIIVDHIKGKYELSHPKNAEIHNKLLTSRII